MEIKIREVNGEWAVDLETPDKIQSIYFKSRQNALSFVKYLELADNVIELDKKELQATTTNYDRMTDNEITREKTFSEELPYFKKRIKEVFDNYDNPNGYEDPLYIDVLRDSKRVVRKAEEEITRQKAENKSQSIMIKMLKGSIEDYKNSYINQKAEIERLKEKQEISKNI